MTRTLPVIATTAALLLTCTVAAGSAASAAPAPAAKGTTTAAPVAVRAPETAAPTASNAFGVIGFTATAKPKPKPKPEPKVVVVPAVAVSSTSDRSSASTASRSTARKDYTSLKPAAGGVLGIAAQYEGLMYSYGGTSPSTGFDCSGFTQYVFGRVGISLPRTAEAQRAATTRVSDPQPGDLVFFGSPAYHVGIYAGNGMMWDSPRSGKAVALRSIWSSSVTYGRP
jgi:cell wall-associated NlpC family hydrolase